MERLSPSPTTPRIGRALFAAIASLILAASTLALLRVGILYSFYTSILAKIIDTTGLDVWQARALALGVLAVVWFLPWHLLLLPWIKNAKRQVVALIVFAALALSLFELITHDVYFSRSDGRPLRYYLRTLDGYKLSASPGTDPVLGLAYQPITAAVAQDYLRWQARGGNVQDPAVPEGRYFSSTTGEALRWYSKLPDGRIDMFTLPGFHPAYGTALRPVTAEIVAEYQKQQAEQDRQRQARAKQKADEEANHQARLEALRQAQAEKEEQDRQARARQTAAEIRRKAREDRDRQARERERLTRPLAPGRYLFANPAPAGDVDGFHYTLTEVDLTPERFQVQMEVANADRTYVETLHQRFIRLGILTADGTALAYTAIRPKEGALPPQGASFAFPSYGQRGAFVMEFARPEKLDQTFSVVVNDQPLFSGLDLHRATFQSF